MYPNIEKSNAHPGEYIGYGTRGRYRIRKVCRGLWRAELQNGTSIMYHGIQGNTLRFISQRLAAND